jgi:hypothetical protein
VKAVDEYGLAALGGILQAVDELKGGQRIPERLVGAGRQRRGGERLDGRQRTDLHVNERPCRGLPYEAKALRDGQDRSRLARHVPEHDEPVTQHRGQACLLMSRLGLEQWPGPAREGRGDIVPRPQPLGVLGAFVLTVKGAGPGAVIPVVLASRADVEAFASELPQPADVKDSAMLVRAELDLHPVTCPPRRGHPHVLRQVRDGHQPLVGPGVPAPRARAVHAQPYSGQPEQPAICARWMRLGIDGMPSTLRRLLGLASQLTTPSPG